MSKYRQPCIAIHIVALHRIEREIVILTFAFSTARITITSTGIIFSAVILNSSKKRLKSKEEAHSLSDEKIPNTRYIMLQIIKGIRPVLNILRILEYRFVFVASLIKRALVNTGEQRSPK